MPVLWFGNLTVGPDDDPDEDGLANIGEYELASAPIITAAVPATSELGTLALLLLLATTAILIIWRRQVSSYHVTSHDHDRD